MQISKKSFCPICNSNMLLLMDMDRPNRPSFFICPSCTYTGEIGVGPVQRLSENGEHEH